jgi:molybdopterin biosynthesis enzyme
MYKDYNKNSPSGRFLRGRLVIENGVAYFEDRGSQKNGSLSSLIECDLLGVVTPKTKQLKKGEMIEAYRI